jgi:predicted helicase
MGLRILQPPHKFVNYEKLKWSRNLKRHLRNGDNINLEKTNICISLYRPFTKRYLYFSDIIVDELGSIQRFFPSAISESENCAIWLKIGIEIPMFALAIKYIPNLLPQSGSQCFPFYTFDEEGSNRQENITDWALEQFRTHYDDSDISKWDIFHYVYAVLHHPEYREKYEANLKRELPRIPFTPDFWGFAKAGEKLADLHVNYEEQEEHPVEMLENPDLPLDWRVEKMKLSKDKTQIVYNDFLTLAGIPPETFEYRLGNRSALDWIIDQYRVEIDKRSSIVNDPNRDDDPEYVVRLIGKVITVSLETMKIVKGLPALD